LYGTAVEGSDLDFKSIYVESFGDVVHRRIKPTINFSDIDTSAGILDLEIFTLAQWAQLALCGQTVAIELLFSDQPLGTRETWGPLRDVLKPLIISKNVEKMVGYCRAQAPSYSVKTQRLCEAKEALIAFETLEQSKPGSKVGDWPRTMDTLANGDHMELVSVVVTNGDKYSTAPALSVCGRKIPFYNGVQYSIDSTLQPLVDRYGRRAQAAASADGVDWKAVMHAIRVSSETVELLQTGHITFPRPDASRLLSIRKGQVPYEELAEELDEWVVRVEEASAASELPDQPNRDEVMRIIIDRYAAAYAATNAESGHE